MKYLLIKDNEVKNIVVADPSSVGQLFQEYEVSLVDPENPVQIGSVFDGTQWVPPVMPERNLPSPPNYSSFRTTILSDPDFNAVFAEVNASHPLLAASIPVVFSQLSSGDFQAFKDVFDPFIAASSATTEQRAAWAQLAQDNHLPTEFIDIIVGT